MSSLLLPPDLLKHKNNRKAGKDDAVPLLYGLVENGDAFLVWEEKEPSFTPPDIFYLFERHPV